MPGKHTCKRWQSQVTTERVTSENPDKLPKTNICHCWLRSISLLELFICTFLDENDSESQTFEAENTLFNSLFLESLPSLLSMTMAAPIEQTWEDTLRNHFVILLICVICTFCLLFLLKNWIIDDSDFRRWICEGTLLSPPASMQISVFWTSKSQVIEAMLDLFD